MTPEPRSTPSDLGRAPSERESARLPRPAPLEWLYLAAGLVLFHRYYWLMDDAFVCWSLNTPPPWFSYQAILLSNAEADSTSASPSPSRSVA